MFVLMRSMELKIDFKYDEFCYSKILNFSKHVKKICEIIQNKRGCFIFIRVNDLTCLNLFYFVIIFIIVIVI